MRRGTGERSGTRGEVSEQAEEAEGRQHSKETKVDRGVSRNPNAWIPERFADFKRTQRRREKQEEA